MPTAWQGWFVIAAVACLVLGGAVVLLPTYGLAVIVAYSVLLCLMLVAICWLKGEPPRWRWGDK